MRSQVHATSASLMSFSYPAAVERAASERRSLEVRRRLLNSSAGGEEAEPAEAFAIAEGGSGGGSRQPQERRGRRAGAGNWAPELERRQATEHISLWA